MDMVGGNPSCRVVLITLFACAFRYSHAITDTAEVTVDAGFWPFSGREAAIFTTPPERPVDSLITQQARTQTSGLSPWGAAMDELEFVVFGTPAVQATLGASSDGGFVEVCEKTRAALFADVPEDSSPQKLLGGPVYRECTKALAPLRRTPQGEDAVNVLNDCMALVDALVAKSGNAASTSESDGSVCKSLAANLGSLDPHNVPATIQPSRPSQARDPVATVAPQLRGNTALVPTAKPDVAEQTTQADLVRLADAMGEVCSDTVKKLEKSVKSESDAMKLSNTVSPACEDQARKRFGSLVDTRAVAPSLQEWCNQLDGRFTLALETGFFFALQPVAAEQQAGRPNPYATATRRQFCDRFATFTRNHARKLVPAPRKATTPVAKVAPAATPAAKVTPPARPVPAARVVETPGAGASAAPVATRRPAPTAFTLHATANDVIAPEGIGAMARSGNIDMLHLMQVISLRSEWSLVCNKLLSSVVSEESSVTDEQAFGAPALTRGAEVLTFNTVDQAEIDTCAATLKGLAVEAGAFASAAPTSAHGATSLISMGQESIEALQELIESPWARDACGDIVRGFLTMRLAHHQTSSPEFCHAYAGSLMHLRTQAVKATTDIEGLRQRAKDLQKMKHRAAESNVHNVDRQAGVVGISSQPSEGSLQRRSASVPASRPALIWATQHAVPSAKALQRQAFPAERSAQAVRQQSIVRKQTPPQPVLNQQLAPQRPASHPAPIRAAVQNVAVVQPIESQALPAEHPAEPAAAEQVVAMPQEAAGPVVQDSEEKQEEEGASLWRLGFS